MTSSIRSGLYKIVPKSESSISPLLGGAGPSSLSSDTLFHRHSESLFIEIRHPPFAARHLPENLIVLD